MRPHEPGEPARHVAEVSDLAGVRHTRGNVWRYEPGVKGRRHRHRQQEETFVVLVGTLSMYLGDPPVRHDVAAGELVRVVPGTPLAEMLDDQGGRVSIATFADALPEAFPAVPAKTSTWGTYARAFVRWFEYAGLVSVQRDVVRAEVAPQSPLVLLTTGTTRARTPKVFPKGHPNGALAVLRYMQGKTTSLPEMTNQRLRRRSET
jgi:hypothetical protein